MPPLQIDISIIYHAFNPSVKIVNFCRVVAPLDKERFSVIVRLWRFNTGGENYGTGSP